MRDNLNPVAALHEAVTAYEDVLIQKHRRQKLAMRLGIVALVCGSVVLWMKALWSLLSSDTAQRVYQAIDSWSWK